MKGHILEKPLFDSSNTGLSSTQYYRLMVMSMLLGLWGTVWIVLLLVATTQFGYSPIPNWQTIHKNISTILEIPTVLMTPNLVTSYELMWWAIPSASYLFAAAFCTSRCVMSEYYNFWVWLTTRGAGRTVLEKKASRSSLVPPSEYVDILPHWHCVFSYILSRLSSTPTSQYNP